MKDTQRHLGFQRTLAALRQRFADTKARNFAVLADAYAIRDRVTRARARRESRPWSPEPLENFVKDRSNRSH